MAKLVHVKTVNGSLPDLDVYINPEFISEIEQLDNHRYKIRMNNGYAYEVEQEQIEKFLG